MADSEKYHVPNLDRALSILELLSKHPKGLIKNEIAGALDISANSVYRITTTLVNRGYLRHDEKTRQLRLSNKMMELCLATVDDICLVERGWDVMCELRDWTTESVQLETRVENEGVVLAQAGSLHALRLTIDSGTRFELHAAAGGKALLAFLPEKEKRRIIGNLAFTRYNKNTITRKEQFLSELEIVRERGYSLDRGECVEGVHCISAPVFDGKGRVVASLTVSGPVARVTEDQFEAIAEQVKEHAARIGKKL